jgi:hypothetical protein
MSIQVFQIVVHFELNCAKKRAFYPPKAGLPPLIGGPCIAFFCTNSLKGAYSELNYVKKGVLLPLKADLPPLIGGSLFVNFLYELPRKGPISH